MRAPVTTSDGMPARGRRTSVLRTRIVRTVVATSLVGMLCIMPIAHKLSAQTGQGASMGRTSPREVYVPADQPEVWPGGRWLARPTAEYRRMLVDFANQQLAPPRAMLRRAMYSATFSGDALNGHFRGEVELRGSEPAYLSLGKATLALHQLVWQDRPAVWGLTPTGEHVVRVHADGDSLEGRWSLRGRVRFGRTVLEATLPPAVISTLQLRLPASLRLLVGETVAVHVSPESPTGWRTWNVNLGRQNQLRLTIAAEADRSAPPWTLVEREFHYALMADGLTLEAVFQFDNLAEDTDRVVFEVTSGLEVTSVVVGNDRELPFQRSQSDDEALVQVSVGSLSGRGRVSIRVLGKVPLPDEGAWTLPRIFLTGMTSRKTAARPADTFSSIAANPATVAPGSHDPGASEPEVRAPANREPLRQPHRGGTVAGRQKPFAVLSSRAYVTVHRPLELRDFSVVDCRLISSSIIRQQSDRLEFEDWSDDAQITVTWDVPRADIIADLLTAVGGDDLQPTFRTLLQLRTRSGSTYEISCRLPRNWQITQVTSQPWHPSQKISFWRTETPVDGPAELLVEFRDALKPGDPVFVEVEASGLSGEDSTLKWLTPQVAELGRVHFAVQPTEGRQVHVPPASSFRPTHAARVRELWSPAIGDWDQWLREAFGPAAAVREPLYFVAENPSNLDIALVPAGEATPSPQNAETGENADASSPSRSDAPSAAPQHASDTGASPWQTVTAEVTIQTTVPADAGQPALQTARYLISDTGPGAELKFELTAPAELISATLNDSEERVALMPRMVHLELPAGVERALVEIQYRTPFAQSFLTGSGEVPLPRSALTVTSLSWRIELPESFRLQPWTDGTSFRSLPFGWRERLLGPLAREATHPLAESRNGSAAQSKPSSTVGEQPRAEEADAATNSPRTGHPETGVMIRRRSLPFTAQTLRLGIWKEDRARRLGWVFLAAALLTTAFAGCLTASWCLTVKSAAIAGTAVTAIVVPEALAVPCGGLFLGALTGAVLPRQMFRRHRPRGRDMRSVGSTRILSRAVTPLLLLALGMGKTIHAFQLEDSSAAAAPPAVTSQAATTPTDEQLYDAMIPVRSGRPTLDETPVVYVRPSLLARWRTLTEAQVPSPAYLLREAQYVVSGFRQAVPRVSANFDVVLLDATATDRIVLPLTDITMDDDTPCRVNGQKGAVIPLQGGAGIMVEIPSAGDTGEDTARPATRDQHSDRVLRIELGFRPHAVSSRGPGGPVQFGIPPVLASTVQIRDEAGGGGQTLIKGFGRTTVSDSGEHILAELGPVRRLEVIEEKPPTASGEAVWVPDLALSLIEVHPRRLSVRSRLGYRITAAEQRPSPLEIRLPETAVVTDVKSPFLVTSHVRRAAGEPARLELVFAENDLDHVEVEVSFTLPGDVVGRILEIPEFPFFAAVAPHSSARHLIAITTSPGFRVAEVASEFLGEWLTPASVSQFQQLWGVPGAVTPELVFSLTDPLSFPLEVTPIQPVREASVVEILACEGSQFSWKADVELECRSAPVAVHRFQIDPRIQVTSVRVVQEGLERHIRWFRGGASELTVLLSDDLVGRQSVTLAGLLPAVLNQSVDLPRLNIPGTPIQHHELHLQRPQGWTVEVFDAEGNILRVRPEDIASTNPPVAGERIRTYDLHSARPPQRFRVSENAAPFRFERIVSLHAAGHEQVRMRTLFRLGESGPLPPRVEFIVPAEWNQRRPLSIRPALAHDRTREDGSAVYVLDTRTQMPPPETVEFAVTVSTPAGGEWTVPTIEAAGGSAARELLVLSGEIRFDVAGNVRSAALDDDLVQAVRLPEESEEIPRRAFASSRSTWTILPTPRFSARGYVRRIESAIWEVPRFGAVGMTSAQVTLHHRDDVTIDLPPPLELMLAMWDDVPLPLPAQGRPSLAIPAALMSSSTGPHHLRLWWKRACPRLQIRRTIALPRILELPVIDESVVFLGSEQLLYEVGAAWKPVSEDALPPATRASTPLARPVARALDAAGIPDQDRTRPASLHLSAAILGGQLETGETPPHSEVTVWRLRRDWQRGLLAMLLFLLLVTLGRKIKSSPLLDVQDDSPETRTLGGLLLLAILLWTMGPPLLGAGLFVLVSVAWARSAWRRYLADSTFDMDSDFA